MMTVVIKLLNILIFMKKMSITVLLLGQKANCALTIMIGGLLKKVHGLIMK